MLKSNLSFSELASYFDHTLLSQEATKKDIEKLCTDAIAYGFSCVFVNSAWADTAKKFLDRTTVRLGIPIGFPLGADSTDIKVYEAKKAIDFGADELDMVINIGALKEGDYTLVLKEIEEILKVAGDRICKVIIETSKLTRNEKLKACHLIKKAGADYVKTSTGIFGHGATIEDVKLLKEAVGDSLKVKASGGIRSLDFALSLIDAGADRLGCSKSVEIMEEFRERQQQ